MVTVIWGDVDGGFLEIWIKITITLFKTRHNSFNDLYNMIFYKAFFSRVKLYFLVLVHSFTIFIVWLDFLSYKLNCWKRLYICFVFLTESNIRIISIFCSWVIKLKCFASARTSVNNAHRNKNLALINFVNFPCNVVQSWDFFAVLMECCKYYVYKPNFSMTHPVAAILWSIHLSPVAFNGQIPSLYISN